MVDFPSSPVPGQPYTQGGVTWTWDGTKWVAQGTGTGVYLPLTGGTMTGDLILNRDAQVALGAATKQQVDARGAGDNRIINGDMRIDQRNNGASGTANSVYTIDRWFYGSNQANKLTWIRSSAGLMAQNGFPYCLSLTSSSAYAALATDQFRVEQPIEADMVSDFAWGTANAQPVTLSFWFNASAAGTYSGAISNGSGPPTRCYPFSFSAIAGWQKITVTVPGDTGGTWVMSGNAAGVMARFDLGSGANYRGPAGAWASANYTGVTGAAGIVATNGAIIQITGVKLEIGSIATPYNRQSLAKSMADCQRYYLGNGAGDLVGLSTNGYGVAAGYSTYVSWSAPTTMRATPTIVAAWSGFVNATAGGISMRADARTVYSSVQSVATGGYAGVLAITSLSAEL